MDDTRLTAARYLDLLHEEGERLLLAAEGAMDLPVPACEGWAVRDVVDHVGMVYGHKIAALELGGRPEPGEWRGPEPGVDEIAWCHGLLHRLAADLSRVAADEPAWTWWEPDQTAGFWQRRMAQETAVHRADVESASGPVTPIASDLAVDGIDELLRVMLADVGVEDVVGPVRDGDHVRVVVAGTTVAGDASDLLLWLWGRAPSGDVEVAGDEAELRDLLRSATQ
jgi:uncharacterized protein (TIGR03083 family)